MRLRPGIGLPSIRLAMVVCCVPLDTPGRFLASPAGVGLIVAALAELARMRPLIALGAKRNAGILETVDAARCTDAGCIRVKRWGAVKRRYLSTNSGC